MEIPRLTGGTELGQFATTDESFANFISTLASLPLFQTRDGKDVFIPTEPTEDTRIDQRDIKLFYAIDYQVPFSNFQELDNIVVPVGYCPNLDPMTPQEREQLCGSNWIQPGNLTGTQPPSQRPSWWRRWWWILVIIGILIVLIIVIIILLTRRRRS